MHLPGLSRRSRGFAAVVLLACTGGAQAMQRITLQNGFSYDCSRQETLRSAAGDQVRLYLVGAGPQDTANYVDLPAASIATIETLPDPPSSSAASAGQPAHAAQPAGDLHALLAAAGRAHDIDVELLASIVHAESGGHADAISRVGAIGLMQLMPSTALSLGVLDARRPEDNIRGGSTYLDALLNRYRNNLALALAAYNAGPAAVDHYHGIPPFHETRAYVIRVMTEFKRRKQQLALNGTAPH